MAVKADSLDDLYATVAPQNFWPGWNKPQAAMWPEPRKTYKPAHWRYREGRDALRRAGDLIGTDLAERRNLIMPSPIPGNSYNTTATLITAYQMLQPGEHARSHRHMANALRLIVEADEGAYTIVNGEKIGMLPGDVVLTPSWMWHGHGNSGKVQAYWIDYLDVPMVQSLEPMFFQDHPDGFEKDVPHSDASPLRFTWQWIEKQLNAAKADPQGRFGRQVTLDTPSMKTIRLHMNAFTAGTKTEPYQTTASNIYSVVNGRGKSTIDGTTFDWAPGDVFAAPPWQTTIHEPETDAVLFRVTDEAALERLGFLKDSASLSS